MWFKIKNKTSITGGKHYYELIQKNRYSKAEIRKQVDAVIQKNAYFTHEENLLLTMLVDYRVSIRQLALCKILAAWKHESQNCSIRLFKVPKVNFQAEQYIDLIDSQKAIRMKPPLTKNISQQDLYSKQWSDIFIISQISMPLSGCWTSSTVGQWSIKSSLWLWTKRRHYKKTSSYWRPKCQKLTPKRTLIANFFSNFLCNWR